MANTHITSFFPGGLLQFRRHPTLQFTRFRSKINIQRPRKPHYERALVFHVAQPLFEKSEKLPSHKICMKPLEVKKIELVDDDYHKLLARILQNWFNQSRMAIFFQKNPISKEDLFKARVLFKRKNVVLWECDSDVANLALRGTIYEAVLHLYDKPITPINIAFSPETDVKTIFKINKKIPELIMLGGIVDHRLMSTTELLEYSELGDLQNVRMQMVTVLNSLSSQLIQNLTHHQNTLVEYLDKHVELQSPELKNNNSS